ncbi:MAG: MotA/TolQ/ExbB proton channel family protein [Methylacidiphilales bacterium]|nr:MotA/TolQ/ExbB proton channel family protein [Candidatus Methylacidiphilales bacterium]
MILPLFAQTNLAPIEEKMGLFQMMQRGGPLMVILFVCSVVALGVFIERLLYYKRSQMNVSEFLAGVLALVRRQSYAEAISRCEEGHGPIVSVVRTAIYKRHLPPTELREVVREIAQLEIPHLEANVSLLGTIGYVAPLLGLLGTVNGMIQAFIQVNKTNGTASVGDLSQGIYSALITSAAGLTVAIPCFIAHNYLAARVHAIVADMERAGIETIHTLTDLPRKDVITVPFTPAVTTPAPLVVDPMADKESKSKSA